MSALNPTIFTLKNPETSAKQNKEINLSEQHECILEIPSHLLQRAIQTCDTKTELVVYMTILRYSVGFNRSRCTLSRRFISTWTGLQYQNVGRGIEGLISKGLVERLPESNLKHGDVFKINFWTESEMTRNQIDYTQPPRCNQSENTQGVIKVMTPRNQLDYEASSERLRGVISLITKNKKEEKEESSSVSPKIQKHLDSMPQAFQRRAEKQSFSQLQGRYSMAQIEDSLDYLLKNGTSSGQKILMPLKYLATDSSMDTVLGIIEKQTSEVQKKQLSVQASVQAKAQQQAIEQQRRDREIHSQESFEKAFPTQEGQLKFISEFMEQRWRCKSIKPSPNIARKLAIADWYKSHLGEAK